MNKRILEIGDIVQINPETHDGFFKGCLMIVSEPKAWGAQGYIAVPDKPRGETPNSAYYRAKWEEMEYVGKAEWIQP